MSINIRTVFDKGVNEIVAASALVYHDGQFIDVAQKQPLLKIQILGNKNQYSLLWFANSTISLYRSGLLIWFVAKDRVWRSREMNVPSSTFSSVTPT